MESQPDSLPEDHISDKPNFKAYLHADDKRDNYPIQTKEADSKDKTSGFAELNTDCDTTNPIKRKNSSDDEYNDIKKPKYDDQEKNAEFEDKGIGENVENANKEDLVVSAATKKRPEAMIFSKLYRLLHDGENIQNGLSAKNPNANQEVAQHVAEGSSRYHKSQYISTCSSLSNAENFRRLKLNSGFKYGNKDIAEIDVGSLPEEVEIIDLRDRHKRQKHEVVDNDINEKFHKFAESHSEVLLKGHVPPSCLTLIKFTGTVPISDDSDDSYDCCDTPPLSDDSDSWW